MAHRSKLHSLGIMEHWPGREFPECLWSFSWSWLWFQTMIHVDEILKSTYRNHKSHFWLVSEACVMYYYLMFFHLSSVIHNKWFYCASRKSCALVILGCRVNHSSKHHAIYLHNDMSQFRALLYDACESFSSSKHRNIKILNWACTDPLVVCLCSFFVIHCQKWIYTILFLSMSEISQCLFSDGSPAGKDLVIRADRCSGSWEKYRKGGIDGNMKPSWTNIHKIDHGKEKTDKGSRP